jgi:hypothetical protein
LQNESPIRPAAQVKQQVSALTEELNSHVMSLSKNVDVVKVVFCTGLIMLSHKTIMVHKILLDSGALHGNYISDTFLHTHVRILGHVEVQKFNEKFAAHDKYLYK